MYGVGTNTMKSVSNIDTATPNLVWTANLNPLTAPLSPLIQYDSNGIPTIYVSGTGKIYSVSATGVVNWVFSPINSLTFLGIKQDGSVIYATAGNQLYALTSAGVQKWVLTVGANSGYPTIGADGTIYFVSGVTVYAVTDNGGLGTLKWTINTGALSGTLRPALAIGSNDVIYAVNGTTTGADSRIFAIVDNGVSAAINWSDNTLPTNPPSLTSVTLGNDGTIYVTGDYGYIASVTDTGAGYVNNYGFQAAPAGFSSACSIGANQRVYYGGDHDLIIAI